MGDAIAKLIIKTEIDNTDFDKDTSGLKATLKKIERRLSDGLSRGLKNALNIGGKLGRTFIRISSSIMKAGLSITGLTAGLGLLATGAVILSKAFKKVFEENEQVKANIDYIKFALLKAIEPAINSVADVLVKIINFLIRIIQYSAYLINAWTGHNIFETATAEAYAESLKNAEKSTAKTAKNAKEIKKQLAGFDEMNILSDNTASQSNTTATTMPNINLSDLNSIEPPKWLLTIERVGKWILDNWLTVVNTLLGIKLFIDLITGNWIGVVIDLVLILIANLFGLKDTLKEVKDSWEETWDIMGEKVDKVVDKTKKRFEKLPKWAQTLIKIIGNAAILLINTLIESFNSFLFPLRLAITSAGKVMGKNWKLDDVSIPKIPYLAKGGIVNMPSRGVPVGNAIVGERGQEGVIPLTDSQQMALLGEAIGRYITINAQMNNYMDGRLINRQLERIQNQSNFAMNR